MSRLEGSVQQGGRAGAQEGVRLQQRDGRPQDREGRRQHGAGRGDANVKIVDTGVDECAHHRPEAGHRPAPKKSIAQFKLRQGMPIGTMVTLRGIGLLLPRPADPVALPRVRDFRGVSPKGFDGRGNYTLGLKDQLPSPISTTWAWTRRAE